MGQLVTADAELLATTTDVGLILFAHVKEASVFVTTRWWRRHLMAKGRGMSGGRVTNVTTADVAEAPEWEDAPVVMAHHAQAAHCQGLGRVTLSQDQRAHVAVAGAGVIGI